MSDNQTSMRKTLSLLESVAKGTAQQLDESTHPKGFQSSGHFADKKRMEKGEKKPYPKLKNTETGKTRPHPADPHPEKLEEADHLDPNLRIAFDMGVKAYQAYKNEPQRAQAAQDKIEAEFPQYAHMWLSGYRDAERFANAEQKKKSVEEGEGDNYHHDAETLAEGALDAAARYIQDELGIETGDAAGMFFTGENLAMIMDVLKQYAEYELQNQRDSDTDNIDPNL